MSVPWESQAKEKFERMIDKVPGAMQSFARGQVTKKAEEIAAKSGQDQISEKEMVDAFFAATPFGFHGPMKADMDALGIDYERYGHK